MEDYLSIQNASQTSKNTLKSCDFDQTMQYDKLIQTYLNKQVFYQSQIEQGYQFQKYKNNQNDGVSIKHASIPKVDSSIMKNEIGPKKSIFHNFQKHLITTLKRYIVIKSRQQTDEIHDATYQIWCSFIKTNSYNKKLLQAVFGVTCPKNKKKEEILRSLSIQFPYFTDVISFYGTDIIISAQEILRNQVAEQASHLTFLLLKSNCHITKFADFYTYFCEFMRQIREGPVSRRMRKRNSQQLKKNGGQQVED